MSITLEDILLQNQRTYGWSEGERNDVLMLMRLAYHMAIEQAATILDTEQMLAIEYGNMIDPSDVARAIRNLRD